MKVNLIQYDKYALSLLLYTKSTRLGGATCLDDVIGWSEEKKLDHLSYMRDTIKSSWEFVTYVFEIKGVSRNFTHQLVRTRTQSYAQESQRTVDVRSNGVYNFGMIDSAYDLSAINSANAYSDMIDRGIPVQDARGILPTDTLTSIIVKTDLRTLHEMAKTRLCVRTQGEYQDVFKLIKAAVIAVHPWTDDFINVACVDSGICCFPRYTNCPIQEHTVKVNKKKKDDIKKRWEYTDHIANPITKNGKTM